MRIEKGIKLIKNTNADALLLLNESNMHYFCGFSPSEGVVFITSDGTGYHIVDSRYTETAQNHAKSSGLKVIEINQSFKDEISNLCKKHNIRKIAFENEAITLRQYQNYKEDTKCEFINIDDKLMRIRNIKDEEEIQNMISAQRIAEKSLEEVMNHIKAGKTEKELQAYLDYTMLKNGSEGVSFDTIFLTGAHTSMPHGVPSNRVIENSDFVLIDFGATYNGYHSDMTRTFAVGYASDEMKEMYDLVLKAQLAGINALKAGAKCSDVYFAAYNALEEKHMGKYFRHSLGHGVGLDIHEGFNASPRSNDIFEKGNATSVEPGIYIPDKFGIRTEDVCIVTESSNRNITEFPKELIIL